MYETFDGGSRYVAFDRIYYLSCIFHDIHTDTYIYTYIYTHMHARGFSFYREKLAFRYVETNLQVEKKGLLY